MCSRSSEEIHGILESAKLSIHELLPLSQEILFDPHISETDLRLLELDKEIVDSIQVGDRLVIRGEDNDAAVLCTGDSTFELKDVETSNSLLIFKQLCYPEDVDKLDHLTAQTGAGADEMKMEEDGGVGIGNPTEQITNSGRVQFIGKRSALQVAHSYYELCKIKPNLPRLKGILEASSYNGPAEEDSENDVGERSITWETLLDQVPASEKEIRDYVFSSMRTFEIDGKIRLVGDDYLFRVLSQVLDCIESYSWETKNINKEVVMNELNALIPRFILEKLFQWFFEPQDMETREGGEPDASASESGSRLYSMNEYEMSRFLGTVILKSGRRFSLQDFLLAWGESVPQGLKVDLNQLKGIAVTDVGSSPQVIWYFPEEELPDTIQDRFAVLFQTKSKWKQEEIMPYVVNVAVSVQNASLLLTKHSRVHTVQGIKYYSSKHAK